MARSGCVAASIVAGVILGLFSAARIQAQAAGADACSIAGTVTSSRTPLPGVTLTLTAADGRTIESTSTGADGTFLLRVRGEGELHLKGELVAFAPIAQAITVNAGHCDDSAPTWR